MSKAVIIGSATDNVTKSAVSYLAQVINEGDTVFATKTFLTEEDAQTVSNKTFNDTNTFPTSLATTAELNEVKSSMVTRTEAQDISNKTFDSSNTFPNTLATKATVDTLQEEVTKLSNNAVTKTDPQDISNKTFDSSNTFPNTLATKESVDSLQTQVTALSAGTNIPENVVTRTGEQSISDKIFDSSNTFPDTLARTDDILSFDLYEFSSITRALGFTDSWLFAKHYKSNKVLILFGQIEVNYAAATKNLLNAGDFYGDASIASKFIIHSSPSVSLTIPNDSETALTIKNEDQLEGSFTFFAVLRGHNYTIGSSATKLI